MLDAILEYLRSLAPGLEVGPDTRLLEEMGLNSLLLLELATFLEDRFGLQLTRADMDPENLATPARVAALVERRSI